MAATGYQLLTGNEVGLVNQTKNKIRLAKRHEKITIRLAQVQFCLNSPLEGPYPHLCTPLYNLQLHCGSHVCYFVIITDELKSIWTNFFSKFIKKTNIYMHLMTVCIHSFVITCLKMFRKTPLLFLFERTQTVYTFLRYMYKIFGS